MTYYVIYDGNCNLCTSLVQLLETLDKGNIFRYAPMQDVQTIQTWGITPQDCELGMILIDADSQRQSPLTVGNPPAALAPKRRWQGSAAAEEIGRLLPLGDVFVSAYRSLPGLKWMGDRAYEQIRDNRYSWFGRRASTYKTAYSADCNCAGTDFN